jgi:lysophospholipase L1-like esterase
MRHLELTDMTCIGATSKDVLEGGGHFQKQIAAVKANTRLVTVTVGGNDASYLGNLWAWSCAKDKSGTPRAWRLAGVCKLHPPSVVRAGFTKLPSLMTKIANVVHRRAPHARLIFVDYTTVLPPSGNCPAKVPLTLSQMDTGRAVATRLAHITAQVAKSTRADLVKASVITKGHDVCSSDPWVYGYHFSSSPLTYGPLAYHPRLAAMQAIANGINNDLKARPSAP